MAALCLPGALGSASQVLGVVEANRVRGLFEDVIGDRAALVRFLGEVVAGGVAAAEVEHYADLVEELWPGVVASSVLRDHILDSEVKFRDRCKGSRHCRRPLVSS